jgi:hypothetical protein
MSTSTLSNPNQANPDQDSRSSVTSQSPESCYCVDQQLKLMDLQAEVESLLQQLQKLQTQRLAVTSQQEYVD